MHRAVDILRANITSFQRNLALLVVLPQVKGDTGASQSQRTADFYEIDSIVRFFLCESTPRRVEFGGFTPFEREFLRRSTRCRAARKHYGSVDLAAIPQSLSTEAAIDSQFSSGAARSSGWQVSVLSLVRNNLHSRTIQGLPSIRATRSAFTVFA